VRLMSGAARLCVNEIDRLHGLSVVQDEGPVRITMLLSEGKIDVEQSFGVP